MLTQKQKNKMIHLTELGVIINFNLLFINKILLNLNYNFKTFKKSIPTFKANSSSTIESPIISV